MSQDSLDSLKRKVFDNIDPASIYINHVSHFYDINNLLYKIKLQDELSFEDRIVQIGKHIQNPPRPGDKSRRPLKIDRNNKDRMADNIASNLKNETKNELNKMFTKKFDITEISKEKYDQIIELLINELNHNQNKK